MSLSASLKRRVFLDEIDNNWEAKAQMSH
jgi:hypothetical protein